MEVDTGLIGGLIMGTRSSISRGSRGRQGGIIKKNKYTQPWMPEFSEKEGGYTMVEDVNPLVN